MRKAPSVFTPINLGCNVVDALSDTPTGVVAVTAQRTNGLIVISVTDNGPGITPGQRDKIFVPCCTTKRHGSGVGLTLVREFAAAHRASVDVVQTPEGGATIRLLF
jgi:C4-dicarboxylate-specific signal transduction histidine kinase